MDVLDLLGRQYLMDYCVLRWTKDQEEKLFKIYVTDGLKNINEPIANFFGGMVFKERYYDMTNRKEIENPKETAEEIKNRIVSKLAALEG